jgi:murein DD-endopeptidase MepM/ murein hydrolase activator NlpD
MRSVPRLIVSIGLLLAIVPFATLSIAAESRATPSCGIDLPASVTPGGLVIGRADPACRIHVGTRNVRVSADGVFVFGVERDAADSVRVVVTPRGGKASTVALPVTPREWRIEKVDGVPQDTVTPPPAIAERIAREQAEVAKARERDDDRADFRFGFAWPVRGRISGVYGSQRVLNGTPKNPHVGLDIAVPEGTPVAAPADGVITFAKPDLYLTGGTLLIDHGHGVSSVFVHLSRIDVKVGASVRQGERVGAAGKTGRATGPHLHWGMNWFETRIDPGLLVGAQ